MERLSKIEKLSDFQLLKHKVYEVIKKGIIELSLLPNEQLVEQRLADNLGVSKSPIREALQSLEREGLVYTLPFKGCFVARITEGGLREIFQLREALESFCVKNGCEVFSPKAIAQGKAILSKAEDCLRRDDVKRCYAFNLRFHDFLITNNQNDRISRTYGTLIDHLDRYRNIGRHITGRVAKSHREHTAIMEALEKRDGLLAESRMVTHLRSVLEEFLESKEIQSWSATK